MGNALLRRAGAAVVPGLLASTCMSAAPGDDWFPAKVVADGRSTSYLPLARVSRPWRVCALLPHARDRYWWGVAWGLEREAQRHGIKLGLYQAGGYGNLERQRAQFDECLAKGADAIVVASISADGLERQIASAVRQGLPVIDLITGASSTHITARAVVPYEEMARAAARYLLAHTGSQDVSVAWLPGPQHAGWVTAAEAGLYRTLGKRAVNLQHAGYAVPEPSAQMGLVRKLFQAPHGGPDYLLGNSVAVEAAANYMQHHAGQNSRAIAFYASEPVLRMVKQGRVLAAVSDAPVLQARIGLDLALRALEKRPYARRVSPAIEVIDRSTADRFDCSKVSGPSTARLSQRALPD